MISDKLTQESKRILDSVPALINKTFPIPGRFRNALPSDVAELSRLLTNGRGDRSLSYLGRPNFLSAYLHYFLPWNLYRLCLLLNDIDLRLSSGHTITDLGSGPLTFISALWIARPDLRNIPLQINCIDRCAPVLEAGNKFFASLCKSDNNPWKINLIHQNIDIRKTNTIHKRKFTNRKGEPLRTGNAESGKNSNESDYKFAQANLVCAINIFNEIYENIPHNNLEELRYAAVNAAKLMHNQAAKDALLLTVEPGVPQSGKFISLLRDEFLELNRSPVSPCTHTKACPYAPSKRKRWCHFAFEAADVPKELRRLSAAAGIPKERLVLSYLFTGAAVSEKKDSDGVRVISDAFPLPDKHFGRYGCCAQGLVLLTGEKSCIDKINSGSLVNSGGNTPVFAANGQQDKKSGALIMAAINTGKKERYTT